ncbi:hypothetical protein, partial [Mesorhizobium sp.]|uniref:hypothetical protein n=1 Tax=Mesorhizobium sp. TaxID=1871066 RepID=UPI002600967E
LVSTLSGVTIESGIGVVIFIFGASAEAVPKPIRTTAAVAQSILVVRIITLSSSTSQHGRDNSRSG